MDYGVNIIFIIIARPTNADACIKFRAQLETFLSYNS